MSEHYRIERIDSDRKPDKKLANDMMHWGKIMGGLRMVPYVTEKGWAGNIGFRDRDVVWVTPSGGIINDIILEEIMGITRKGDKLLYFGHPDKKPTSEWEIYWDIFMKRPEINAILHGHDLFALETAEELQKSYPEEVTLTRGVTESGSAEFRDDMGAIMSLTNTYLIGRDHGFFALGRDFEEAGMLALEFRSRANEIMIGEAGYRKIWEKYHIG